MQYKKIKPYPGMVITENTEFECGVYDFFGKNGLIIGADNIVILGNGVHIKGGCKKEEKIKQGNTAETKEENTNGNSQELDFYGTGILIEEKKGVTIKDLKISGFDMGLHAINGSNLFVENCDFSDCFTDPAWGWDDHGFHGGIFFEHMRDCCIQNCMAKNVWDALHLRFSDDNTVQNNNFSHTSDTGLKLWNSSRNKVCDNDFSYGLRIDPGEVHARDSACVLIESGSNDNIFQRNDMSHGGDGLFIRVLNGWMSTGNCFEENDCSYANNNAVEAWADGNTYIHNKANYSSYGFWLGGSDNTVLIGNEAAFNGDLHKNAPEAFGNAGVSVVNNSGSHFVMEDNYIHDNHGPGIAIRYRRDYPSYHWVIQGNRIENNKTVGRYKGHGIYIKNARWIIFGKNSFEKNDGEPIFLDANTSDIVFLNADSQDQPVNAVFTMVPEIIGKGETATFKASEFEEGNKMLRCRWDFGDGTAEAGERIEHVYKKAGFYRMGLTVDNGSRASIAFKNIYVLPLGCLFGTGDEPEKWSVTGNSESYKIVKDMKHTVSGQGSICIKAGTGTEHILTYPASGEIGLDVEKLRVLNFYMRYITESEPDWERSARKPVITLYADNSNYIRFIPANGIMERYFVTNNEEKNNWQLISFDIDNPNEWDKYSAGNGLDSGVINSISIEYGNVHPGICQLWLDGLCFSEKEEEPLNALNLAQNKNASDYPAPIFSSCADQANAYAPLRGELCLYGDSTCRFTSAAVSEAEAFYGVDFGCIRKFDRVDIYFYRNQTETLNAKNESVPLEAWLEAEYEGKWEEIAASKIKPAFGQNKFLFKPVLASRVRVRFIFNKDYNVSIYCFSVFNTFNAIIYKDKGLNAVITSNIKNMITVDAIEVKLNKEINANGAPLGDLVARVFKIDNSGRLTDCLLKKVVPRVEIVPYGITKIETNLSNLECGRKYALVLGQNSLAESRTVGDYYRWIAGETDCDETFAIYDNGETKPSDYDWGTAYLRVLCSGITMDYSNESEHVGVRFGIKGLECRYMTFSIPNSLLALTDGIAGSETGWVAEASEAEIYISFIENVCINGANIWIDGDIPQIIEISCNGKTLASAEKPQLGLVRLFFEATNEKNFILRINCKGKCVIKEVELEKL